MKKFKRNTFYCFSPLVMVSTMIIEVALAIYLLLTRQKTLAVKIGVVILLALAVFQLAEYGICEDLILMNDTWAKIGFVSITVLPVAGIHLISTIAGKTNKTLTLLAYLSGLAWIILFLFGNVMENSVCNGNYVIFNLKADWGGGYFIYYYFWILVGAGMALYYGSESKKNIKHALYALVIGYASFVVPATYIWLNYEGAAQALPSIMCGFALIFALILALVVLPLSTKSKKQ